MMSEDKILKEYLSTFGTMKLFEQDKKNKTYGPCESAYEQPIDWLKGWQACARMVLEIKEGEYCECCGNKTNDRKA